MSITFDKALGIHQDAIKLRSQRAQLLANNLANADTPGFKAKDIDFKEVLKNNVQLKSTKMSPTHTKHFTISTSDDFTTKYRIPVQPSVDGNTVNEQVEISKYTENSLQYLASLRFLNSKFKGIMTALRGE